MNASETKQRFYAASDDVERGLMINIIPIAGEDALNILRRVAFCAKHFVQMEAFTTAPGMTIRKPQLEAAINHAVIDVFGYSRSDVEAALKGELTPTDPKALVIVNYMKRMHARLDAVLVEETI
ncbi:MAG: hypothetical protein US89_C0006G0065 [Candidatus Peregrinibacteria bacterium GW2011_GWF2_38_29]|nr:MAG: hypothetical protein US89_C0006G0065 [Candidatus Peregrinibacteria bacterium GW2011_GWF2_38_29]HBB03256.1 hypothetical protein [Candidatus Peregrinibacteria bacterium]